MIEEIKQCTKTHLNCGHQCNGALNEIGCLPCLEPECAEKAGLKENKDELCSICYTSELGAQPCVQLPCGHVFHADCVMQLLEHKWSTLRVSFAFLSCPSCKQEISQEVNCLEIRDKIIKLQEMKDKMEVKALEVAKDQGLDKSERYLPGGDYEGDLKALALHSCSFYQCFECEKIYFGGMIDCQMALGQEERASKEDLRCQECQLKASGAGQTVCPKHQSAHIDWKCNFCCSVALFHCFGTTYFCKRCHDEYSNNKIRDCGGVNCPLGVPHPPADKDYKKSTFALGCSICRSENLEKFKNAANLIAEVNIEDINKRREAEEAERIRLIKEAEEKKR